MLLIQICKNFAQSGIAESAYRKLVSFIRPVPHSGREQHIWAIVRPGGFPAARARLTVAQHRACVWEDAAKEDRLVPRRSGVSSRTKGPCASPRSDTAHVAVERCRTTNSMRRMRHVAWPRQWPGLVAGHRLAFRLCNAPADRGSGQDHRKPTRELTPLPNVREHAYCYLVRFGYWCQEEIDGRRVQFRLHAYTRRAQRGTRMIMCIVGVARQDNLGRRISQKVVLEDDKRNSSSCPGIRSELKVVERETRVYLWHACGVRLGHSGRIGS